MAATPKTPNLIEVIKGDLSKLTKKKANKGPVKDRTGLWGKISFGLGILSMGAWFLSLIGLPIPIAGIVLGILGLRATEKRWYAVTGLTLSIVFLNITVVYIFYGLLMSMLYGG